MIRRRTREIVVLLGLGLASAAHADTQAPTAPYNLEPIILNGSPVIILTWGGSTDNVAVTGYSMERCEGASCTSFAQIATPGPTDSLYQDLTSTSGTTYRYRIRARDAVPNWSAYSDIVMVTAPATDTGPPTTPSGVSATAINSGRVDLAWTASTDDIGVTGYGVERCEGASCTSFAQITTRTVTGYSDFTVSPNTTYRYRIRARDALNQWSNYSAIVSATPVLPDTQAPTVPSGVSSTAVSSSQINVTWNASTDNVAVTGYAVERCQGASCTSFAEVATPTGTSFNDTGRSASTTYRYRVRARDAVPNWSGYSSIISRTTPADTQAPTVPAGVSATAISSTQVNITWSASTDNVAVTGYAVERCQGASCTSFAQVATPAGTNFSDTGRTANTTYRYRVRARDAVPNWSGYSSIVSATTPVPDTQAPTTPTGLSVAPAPTVLTLSWNASTDNSGTVVYRIERCSGAACSSFAEIGTTSSTTYADSSVLMGTQYRYRVRASDLVPNYSGYSNVGESTPQECD